MAFVFAVSCGFSASVVDFNCNPAETWDIILTTELPTLEDVNTYANHPEHVAVAKGIIGPVKADRACVDYEIL